MLNIKNEHGKKRDKVLKIESKVYKSSRCQFSQKICIN